MGFWDFFWLLLWGFFRHPCSDRSVHSNSRGMPQPGPRNRGGERSSRLGHDYAGRVPNPQAECTRLILTDTRLRLQVL